MVGEENESGMQGQEEMCVCDDGENREKQRRCHGKHTDGSANSEAQPQSCS